ncbi:type II toxin-antitoxin system HicB family antitoxin [Nostoc sp.]|uniref:type II toxin-antitoxin system HicB family antitoxin n=1 Tax=Nostoc sp. TaxID=1180 RepID=UPI002FF5208C
MLASYIDQAMELAVYEIVEEDQTYWGKIPSLQGVWANYQTLEGYRRELREALSELASATVTFGVNDSCNRWYQPQ